VNLEALLNEGTDVKLSAEVRWFWPGDQKAILWPWFATGAIVASGSGEARSDDYLCDPEQPALGIKRRGSGPGARGNPTEFKVQVAHGAMLSLGHLSATTEIWTRVVSGVLDISRFSLISVRKQRWVRRFDTAASDVREVAIALDAEETASRKVPTRCCDVELAVVTLDSAVHPWTTLGFQAFGGLEQLQSSLAEVVRKMAAQDLPAMPEASAQSYAMWIARSACPIARA
jgi:hypothetical protein